MSYSYNYIFGFLVAASLLCTVISPAQSAIPTRGMKKLFDINTAGNAVLSKPTDVAVDENNIFIVDGDNNRIVVFNKRGEFEREFGTYGTKQGQFNYPVGIGLDEESNIYVADTRNHRVQVFDEDGDHQRTIKTVIKGTSVRPVDVAVSKDQKRLYVSTKANKLIVYKINGKKLHVIGQSGTERGEFRFPGSVYAMSNGRVGVIDILNFRLQVLNKNGKFSYQVGDFGVRPGLLIRPKGIALDKRGQIYLSDSYMDVIQVYSNSGKFKYVIGHSGVPLRVQASAGIAIDKQNRLFVTEVFANRVSVYQLE